MFLTVLNVIILAFIEFAGVQCLWDMITALPVDLVTLQKIHLGVKSCSLLFDHLKTLCEE